MERRWADENALDGGAAPTRLDSLTGLRFVAALLVFANHIGDVALPGERDGAAAWFGVGRVGVSFFFVLSGFVLTWSGAASVGRGAYFWRRVARVMPNHLVTWLVAVVALVATGAALSSTGAVLSLPLLHAWVPATSTHFSGNPVSWSLSCELFFYASFPFLLTRLEPLRRRGRWAAMLGAAGATMAFPLAAAATLPATTASWAVYVLPLARLPEFVLGVLLALELREGRLARVRPAFALASIAVGIGVATLLPPVFRPAAVTVVPFAMLIVAAAQQDLRGNRSWMSSRRLVRLGEWSFAFYLVHRTGIAAVDRGIGFAGQPFGVTLLLAGLALGIGVGLSAALYTWLERPAERRLRARGGLWPSTSRPAVIRWPAAYRPRPLGGVLVAFAVIASVAVVVVSTVGPGHRAAAAAYIVPAADGVQVVPLLTVGGGIPLEDGYRFVGGAEGLGAAAEGSQIVVYADHDLDAGEGTARSHGETGAFVSRLVMDPDTLAITGGSDLIAPGTEFWDYPTATFVRTAARFADGSPQDDRFSNFNSGRLTARGRLADEASGTGYDGRVYFANEENPASARAFGITEDGQATMLPRLGLFARESTAVAADTGAATVVIGTEDASSGQLWMYVGTKQDDGMPMDRAGLTNGSLFAVAAVDPEVRTDADVRSGSGKGNAVGATFEPIDWNATADQQNAQAAARGLTFDHATVGRFDPQRPNDYYFLTAAGGDTTPDSDGSRDGGGLWRLRFVDVARPELGASLVLLLDGSEDVGRGRAASRRPRQHDDRSSRQPADPGGPERQGPPRPDHRLPDRRWRPRRRRRVRSRLVRAWCLDGPGGAHHRGGVERHHRHRGTARARHVPAQRPGPDRQGVGRPPRRARAARPAARPHGRGLRQGLRTVIHDGDPVRAAAMLR